MNKQSSCAFSLLLLLWIFIPAEYASADVYLPPGSVIDESETWTAAEGPYHIQGALRISQGTVLEIRPGTQVLLERGSVRIEGSMRMLGTEGGHVRLHQDAESLGFSLSGASVEMSFVDATGGSHFIESASSSVRISDSSIQDISNQYYYAFQIHDGSSLMVSRSSLQDILSTWAFAIYADSSLTIDDSTMQNVGESTAIMVGADPGHPSSASLRGVRASQGSNFLEAYDASTVDILDSDIGHMAGSAVAAVRASSTRILRSSLSYNGRALNIYNSSVSVRSSVIEHNSDYGYYLVSSVMTDIGNTWDPEQRYATFGYSPIVLEGDIGHKATSTPCCSSMLFIPGLESSRLYRKQLYREDQLWEPNANSDASKLYLDEKGNPKTKGIYTRDIILKTNIGLGIYDKDIYAGFASHLDQLKSSSQIADWASFPYDWRMDPNSVALNGQPGSEARFASLESALGAMASSSKTGKVMLIGHSYGGIILKRFLKHLHAHGKDSLVDNVMLVAVPEQGTVESVGALLHGDDQEIAGGLFQSSASARSLGKNMPSAYYLLPNSDLLSSLAGWQVIQHDASSWFGKYAGFISKQGEPAHSFLKTFLLNLRSSRPYARTVLDVTLPDQLNKLLYGKAETERAAFDSDPFYMGMKDRIYNIVGTGVDTVKGYLYKKEDCLSASLGSGMFIPSPSVGCGLDHEPLYTIRGDGTVLTGDMEKRWGRKIIFNIGAYNLGKSINIAHADIMLAEPVLSAIDQVLKGLPVADQYLSSYSPDSAEEGTFADETEEYSISDSLEMVAEGMNGLRSGLIPQPEFKKFRPVLLAIPNSTHRKVGSRIYLTSREKITRLNLIPIDVKIERDEFGDPKPEYVSIRSTIRQGSVASERFRFEDIPVLPETVAHVEMLEGSTIPAVLHLDLTGSGTYETVFPTYPAGPAATASPADIHGLIQRIRMELSTSSERQKIKDRYDLRLGVIDKYYLKGKSMLGSYLSQRNADSLRIMKRELSGFRDRYYRGGMLLSEVTFLEGRFAELASAFEVFLAR